MAERDGCGAFLETVFADAVDEEEGEREEDHFERDDEVRDGDGEVVVGQFRGGVEILRRREEGEDDLGRTLEGLDVLIEDLGSGAHILQELEEDNALECNELRQRLAIADLRSYGLVEAEDRHNRYGSGDTRQDGDPNVCEV